MKVNYWDCEFSDYEEGYEDRFYGCSNINNPVAICELDNKYCDSEDDCPYLNINQPSQ